MSLECRILKKIGANEIYYYCRNTGVKPYKVALWTDPAETPKEIEHYFKNLDPITIGPSFAKNLGIFNELYPELFEFPVCHHPKYEGENCIMDYCGYAPCEDWTKCPYFKQNLKGILIHENLRN